MERTDLVEQAMGKGFQPMSFDSGRVWVPLAFDLEGKGLPAIFLVERVVDGKAELVEFKITSPVEEILANLKAVSEFYERSVGVVPSMRHGVDGLIEFLKERTK